MLRAIKLYIESLPRTPRWKILVPESNGINSLLEIPHQRNQQLPGMFSRSIVSHQMLLNKYTYYTAEIHTSMVTDIQHQFYMQMIKNS